MWLENKLHCDFFLKWRTQKTAGCVVLSTGNTTKKPIDKLKVQLSNKKIKNKD